MSNRHLSRTIALQSLFEWDFNDRNSKIDDSLEYNVREFSTGMCDLVFAQKLLNNVIGKKETIDNIIEKAAPQWPIDRISIVDRNVLRIGIFELIFADRKEVPPKVAINEAIELAKMFGGPNSGRFVSGVLGTIYKELGEPDKDQKAKSKKKIEDVPFGEMTVEKKCGAVVYSTDKDNIRVALTHDVFGYWTLPKGSIEEGGCEKKGIIAKVKEKIGVDAEIEEKIGDNEYVAYDPERGKVRRQVVYRLAKADFEPLTLPEGDDAGGLDQAKWFKLDEILNLKFYDDILPIITKAVEVLKKKKVIK